MTSGDSGRTSASLRRLAGWALALVMACLGLAPAAHAQCSNLTVTLNPAVSSINVSAAATGTIWSGSLTVTGTGCTTAAVAGGHYLYVPIGSTAQATTVSGISVIRNGSPTYAVLSGNCVLDAGSSAYWTNINNSGGGFTGSSGVCSTSMTLSFSFVKPAAGAVSGTISPSKLLANPNNAASIGMTAWAGTVDYSAVNTGNQILSPISLAPSAITFNTIGCTLTPATTTVNLPTVAPSALAVTGATAGRKPFTLTLAGCTYPGAAYSAIATWTFVPAASATVIGNTAASPKAANVGVQLLDANLNPLTDGGSAVLANVTAAGGYSRTFYAQYYATGAAGAGNVTGQATFTLSYQ